MKTFLLLGLIAFGSMSFAASVTDGAPLSSTLLPDVAESITSPVALKSVNLNAATHGLVMVTDDGVGNPIEIVAVETATSVPESAGAAFLALFGYILMLRRRTT